MTSTAATLDGHPIAEFAERLGVVLDGLAHAPAWSMTRQEQAAVIVALTRHRARIDELLLRVLAAGDRNDVALMSAATSTTAWVAHATVRPAGAVHADVKLAFALDEDFAATQDALAAGQIDAERARVVVRAVQALPTEAVEREPALARRAEKHLLGLALVHDAKQLTRLGRHLLHALDPDAADQLLGRELEAEEQNAARATYLEMHDNGDGTTTGRFKVPVLQGAMLRRALSSLTNPAARALGEPGPSPTDRGRRDRPARSCWVRRSVSSSNGSTPPGCRGVAASTPPPWSRWTTNACCPVWGPPGSTPANPSRPARLAGWPVRPASSPPSSAISSTAAPWCSIWAASAASTPSTCA